MVNDNDPNELAKESWIMYGVGMCFIVLRLAAQIHRYGWRDLLPDDGVMIVTAALYTALIITLDRSVRDGGGNGFTDAEVALMDQATIDQHVVTARFVNSAEQCMLLTIYSVKVCMLSIYSRLTMGLKERLAVKVLAGYVATGFIVTEIAMFTLCIPYTNYWAVPVGDGNINQCSYYKHYSIVQAVFNTTSDALMLAIPLPLLIRARLPLRQKVVVCMIFGMGLFVIIAAVLSKSIALLPANYGTIVYAFWYLREASVAVYVANLPALWPAIRLSISWVAVKTGHGTISDPKSRTGATGTNGTHQLHSTAHSRMHSHRLPDEEGLDGERWDDNSSQERIIEDGKDEPTNGAIVLERTFEVEVSENRDFAANGGGQGKQPLYDERNNGRSVYKVNVT